MLRGLLGGAAGEGGGRLADHRVRGEGPLQELRRAGNPLQVVVPRDALAPEEALSVLVVALTTSGDYTCHRIASQLVRQRLPYSLDDARLLVELTEQRRADVWTGRLCARAALAALDLRVAEGDRVGELTARLLAVVLAPHHYEASEWLKLGPRVRKLMGPATGQVDLSTVGGDDPWSAHVRPLLGGRFSEHVQLLELLGSATGSRPSRRWLAAVEPLLAGDGAGLPRLLVESAAELAPQPARTVVLEGRELVFYHWLSDASATVVRGALWASSLVPDGAWVTPACERLLDHSRRTEELKVSNAAFYCLAERGDDAGVALLGRLVSQVKDRRFLKPAQAALERAAGKRGVTSGQLREQLVPTFDLDVDGRGIRQVGPAEVALELAAPGTVKLRYRLGGIETAGAPQALADEHASELAALKREVAELRKELGVQRLRLEELLAAGRVWTYDDWHRDYLEQPLVQLFARRLIWRFDGRPAIPLDRDSFLGLQGAVEPPESAEVRLWHPLDATTQEIAAWRALLRERELRQPFKQAYRELYVLAPAERESRVYSNRFAAHIVRYPQVYALAKQRGWGIRALGPYDNGGGEQWRDFPEHGLRASFWMELADPAEQWGPIAALAATDQVRFSRIGAPEPLPLEEIPPHVFSEAMRDVDLFVGVASIAADPTWIDGGVDRFHAYWREHAFGSLDGIAEVRREALAQLLPGLKVADRLELEERFLRVRGNLHNYRIHLGSANIMIEPHDRYLCIVPDRRPATGKLFLPFEDERLSLIISKALLLVADDRITDPAITRQLP